MIKNTTYFNASALTFPRAPAAASRTSAASHRKSGTVNLYRAAGAGPAGAPGDLLSPLSALKESGDELWEVKI